MELEEHRGPGRPRKEDSVRTAIRSPIRERKRKGGAIHDRFHIDASSIPEGITYEWKRHTTYGQSDPTYDVDIREQGWEAVPADRHPELVPAGHRGPIVRGGLMLMERPVELTREAQQEDRDRAAGLLQAKKEQLGMSPRGQFERGTHPGTQPSVRTTYESLPIDE